MKIIILILAVLGVIITTPTILKSNTSNNTEWLKIETQKDLRNYRFSNKPSGGKVYRNDTDLEVYGTNLLEYKKMVNKQIKLNNNRKNQKQQNSKFKSTYLDFTILQEENIS